MADNLNLDEMEKSARSAMVMAPSTVLVLIARIRELEHARDWNAARIRSLEAAPQPAAAEWQPIETAPKHKEVLVWREDSGPFIAKLIAPEDYVPAELVDVSSWEDPSRPEWLSDAYGWQEGSERPTHWQPLPAPPCALSGSGENE